MKAKPKLKDIAEKFGVSVATVSYVYNNKWKEKRINEKLAKEITEYIKKNNYRPNSLGLQLKTGKTYIVGIILGDLTRNFNLGILSGIEKVLAENSYFALIADSELGEKEEKNIKALYERNIDALIIAPNKGNEVYKTLKDIKKEVPIVLVDNYFPNGDIDFVVSDNKWGSYMAIGHLIKEGYRKIGYIGSGKNLTALNERFEGYIGALNDNKIKINKNWIYKEISKQEDVYLGLKKILGKDGVEAIFCESLIYFKYGFKFLHEKGLKIPEDILISGFDPINLKLDEMQEVHFDEVVNGKIPYVQQKAEEIGEKAARIIIEKLNGKKEIKQMFIKPELKCFEKGE